jgi:hypothetical protein
MKIRNTVSTALILGGGAYYIFAAIPPGWQDQKPTESTDRESGQVALITKLDIYIYSQNNVKLGVLDKDSCVLVQPPLQDRDGFQPVAVNTALGTIHGSVAARFLSAQGAGTVENCKSEIRQIYADPAKPETKDLPQAETYLAPRRTPLYFGTTMPPSGLFAEAGSCIILMSSGHTDKMFHVMVWGPMRMGEAYVDKNTVVPIGNYDWNKGCDAIVKGASENHRPKPVQETPTGDNLPDIRRGDLYIVTADRLELRSGPGADFSSLNTIFKNSCVQALGGKRDKNGFVEVLTSYDQKRYQKGFVRREDLKPTPQGRSKMDCFIR